MKTLILTLICFFLAGNSHAQEGQITNTFSFGIQLSQYQNDFGMGVNVTSPHFANQKMAVRVRSNVMFHEHVQNQETTWTPYINTSLGVTGITGTITDAVRLYGEGGIIGLFPSAEFSSENFKFGGYGLFGFEFYFNPQNNYFIEIGGVGTGAKADRVPLSPIYSNGLFISTGFRMHI